MKYETWVCLPPDRPNRFSGKAGWIKTGVLSEKTTAEDMLRFARRHNPTLEYKIIEIEEAA